ncbi:MAG TPA: hypothetical protein VLM85_04940, partial [Polyangiaceae bacterium]|nr:hypothetical protein [Polyangiaceae bacterium]
MAVNLPALNKKVGNLLLKLGLLKPEQFEKAMEAATTAHQRIEDTIIELGIASEQDVLKTLATHYKTRFVST